MNEQDWIRAKEEEIAAAQQSGQQNPYSAMMGAPQKQNIVEWELDFTNELGNIERLLKCDVLSKDDNGNEVWTENPDKNAIFLNKKGVDDVLRQIILLVNKNKVLSYYTPDEVKERVRIIGHELRAFIYNNYVEYEINNDYKMNNFSPIVMAILDVIEAAYRRALNGETHRGLSEARFVQQNEPISQPQNFNIYPQPKKRLLSRMMPWNWGR